MWTPEEYDNAVQNLGERLRGEFGVTANCSFNELESFHCIGQFPNDAMHDFLERTGPCDALSITKALIGQGHFTLEDYNATLRNIPLKGYESRSRPPPIKAFNEKLPGGALAVSQHIRLQPYIYHLLGLPEGGELLDLMSIIHKINEYVLADKISTVDPLKFEDLLVDYFEKRKACSEEFPTFQKIVPKSHFMEHYPDLMCKFGPFNLYWTARGEAKHRTFVNFAESAKNFKNITKTFAVKNQAQLASR
jgi:hypothetical protein